MVRHIFSFGVRVLRAQILVVWLFSIQNLVGIDCLANPTTPPSGEPWHPRMQLEAQIDVVPTGFASSRGCDPEGRGMWASFGGSIGFAAHLGPNFQIGIRTSAAILEGDYCSGALSDGTYFEATGGLGGHLRFGSGALLGIGFSLGAGYFHTGVRGNSPVGIAFEPAVYAAYPLSENLLLTFRAGVPFMSLDSTSSGDFRLGLIGVSRLGLGVAFLF